MLLLQWDGGPQDGVKMRVVGRLKTFGTMRKMCKFRSVSLGVNYECSQKLGYEPMRKERRHKVHVMEMKCPRRVPGVTRKNEVWNEEVRRRVCVRER